MFENNSRAISEWKKRNMWTKQSYQHASFI